MRPHISYSELAQFANGCQHQWMLNHLKGLRAKNYSVHFDFGHAIHLALENYKRKKKPISLDLTVVLFKKNFSYQFQKNWKKYNLENTDPAKNEKKWLETRDALLLAGENILRRFDECEEIANAEVVFNEYRLFEPIDRDDVKISFKGFIDFVIRTKDKRGNTILYVCDFKTCQWGWDRDKRSDRWIHYQVFLYKHFLCKKMDIDPKFVRTAFVLLKKRPPPVAKGSKETIPPVEFFPVSAGPVSVQRALDALNENITEMIQREKEGVFPKNRKHCTDDYGNVCPFFNTEHCT